MSRTSAHTGSGPFRRYCLGGSTGRESMRSGDQRQWQVQFEKRLE
jgi:hypothetical protein